MGTMTEARGASTTDLGNGLCHGEVRRWVRATICWAPFLLAVLLTTLFLGWILLGIVLLGSGPYSSPYAAAPPVLPVLAGTIAITASLAWLTARLAASWRQVVRAVGLVVTVVAVVGVTWALSAPDQALYWARELAWDGGNPRDYQEYPQRAISNGPSAYHFPQNPSPHLFQTIQYQQGGQLKRSSLNDFLTATQTTSFIVIKDGAILDESYANGYARDSMVTSESDAKSFTSALIGIAMDEGYLGSVNDRMVSYLPELRGKGLDDVTIYDLLTMSAGISFTYGDEQFPLLGLLPLNDNARTTNYPDLRRLMLSVRPGTDPPGAAFSYNNAQPLLLGMILERTTHRSVSQYLQEKIWQPLGMEYPASWSLDSKQSGFEKMAMGLNARAIDFAKFGQLYLDNGLWNGKQVVPAEWVRESTAPDPTDRRPWRRGAPWKQASGYYGYLWWGQIRPDGSYVYMARGGHNVGQLQWIYVSPKDRVVIVQYGLVDGSVDSWPDVFQTIADALSR
jgi:CubicO group peptidase (beta-lactamase class C family)